MIRLGATVATPDGPGVVVDRVAAHGEALVRLDSGTEMDTTHGAWFPFAEISATGFDADALVWWGQRQVRASAVPATLNQ